jgi:hypothetical protein
MKRLFLIPLLALFISGEALALATEIGLSFNRKRTSFDANNYLDSESLTGSVSLYFFERLALEMSYTSATGVREEKLVSNGVTISQQTVVQTTQVYGADLIWVLADRKEFFQPYVKGGFARIQRVQQVKVNSLNTYTLEPDIAIVPSWGLGCKLALTPQFGIKLSYDAWKTPLGEGAFSNDDAVRAGVTWMF